MGAIGLLAAFLGVASATIYLKEDFSGDWESRWVASDWKKDTSEAGEWEVSSGKFFADEESNKGLRTTEDAKFYAISTKFPPFSNKGKTLVVQYVVKHEQGIDCGGGYLKLFPSTVDQKKLHGGADEDVYNIMFGPDICGYDKKTHVIFHYNGENKLVNKNPKCESDSLSHLYTLVVTPDGNYKVSIDMEEVQSGALREDWDFLLPKIIKDPSISKPSDWVDETMMDDPDDVKPEGWDDIPQHIADPDATQPDDWDEEDDGTWEAPNIDNPEFKGEWIAPKVTNPAYKGEWSPKQIANKDYEEGVQLAAYESAYVGFELWIVNNGTIFDNILVTDSLDHAKEQAEKLWRPTSKGEKEKKEAWDKENKPVDEAPSDDDEEPPEDEGEEEEGEKDEL